MFRRLILLPLGLALFASSDALAKSSGAGIGSGGEAVLVGQIVLLMLIGRGLGEVMQRFGQPAVIGQLLAGLILGPSLFGWVWPEAHAFVFPNSPEQKNLITGLANMGVMMLLLLTGIWVWWYVAAARRGWLTWGNALPMNLTGQRSSLSRRFSTRIKRLTSLPISGRWAARCRHW